MFRNRQPSGDPATRILILANVVVFLVQEQANPLWWWSIEHWLALTGSGLWGGAIWQLVTYQFLHANVVHILMNMVGLWFIGRELEPMVGTRRFVGLYLAGGVIGGLAQVLFSPSAIPLVGASGSVCAVLLAFTTLRPRLPVVALVVFLPVPMNAGTLGLLAVAVSIATWLSGYLPQVGHLAHLGGFATGWAFGRAYQRRFKDTQRFYGRSPFSKWGFRWRGPLWQRGLYRKFRSLPTVDELLAKVHDHGIQSLTNEERRMLDESRRPR